MVGKASWKRFRGLREGIEGVMLDMCCLRGKVRSFGRPPRTRHVRARKLEDETWTMRSANKMNGFSGMIICLLKQELVDLGLFIMSL